jgi:hypothetical protein
MRPPLSGVGSICIQMIYTSMNGHRGGYELCVTSAHAVAHQLWVKRAEERTHRRKRVRKMQMGIILVHSATEMVWSLRTRGMLAGTKLEAWRI